MARVIVIRAVSVLMGFVRVEIEGRLLFEIYLKLHVKFVLLKHFCDICFFCDWGSVFVD